jgi:hypothetical protein
MAEWSIAAVLKTVVRATGPGVRIPLSPPKQSDQILREQDFLFLRIPNEACFNEGLEKNKKTDRFGRIALKPPSRDHELRE